MTPGRPSLPRENPPAPDTIPGGIDSTIDALKVEVDALSSSNIQNGLKRARDRAVFVTAVKTAIDTAENFDVATYTARVSARDKVSIVG